MYYREEENNLLDSYIHYAATASVLLKGPKTTIMFEIMIFWQLCQLELENTKHSLPCRINVVLQGKTVTKHDCAAPSPHDTFHQLHHKKQPTDTEYLTGL